MSRPRTDSSCQNNPKGEETMKKTTTNKGRRIPDGHPNKAAEFLKSSKETGLRMISVVERSGVVPFLDARFARRRGRKQKVSYKALLVAILIAMHSEARSYTRAGVCLALAGLKPSIARSLGVLDADGQWHIPSYKSANRMIKRMERALRSGWLSGDTVCDLDWFAASMIRASVPRRVRRSVKTIVIDSTAVYAWAAPRSSPSRRNWRRTPTRTIARCPLNTPICQNPNSKGHSLPKRPGNED